jgi:hypothetical protein
VDPACVGCERVPAVTSGYCQSCSDTAEAWSTERAERLERTIAGLEAAERKGWTVYQLDGLSDPDYTDRLYRDSMRKMTKRDWRIVHHEHED